MLLLLVAPKAVQAQSDDCFSYSINASDTNTITITGYTCTNIIVTIPSNINNLTVTSIGDYAFYDLTNVTSVTIPNGVTNIGQDAFAECSSVATVTIPSTVTSIGQWAFAGSGLASAAIPSNVTSVVYGMFWGCINLTSVTIPNSVASIEQTAFIYCTSLTSVTIPNSVTNIAIDAFAYCSSLTSVYFDGNAPSSAGSRAFFNDQSATAYYYSGTSGWGSAYGGIPAVEIGVAQMGSLQVTISPAGAVTSGAQWQVDGGAFQSNSATVSRLSAGNHTVMFSTVSGWTTPANQGVLVSANSTAAATGTYVAQEGEITYDLVSYPTAQSGYALTGTVTTDGTLGNLSSTNIVSWSWQAGGTWSGSSVNPAASAGINGVVATLTSLYLPSAPTNFDGFELYDYRGDFQEDRMGTLSGNYYSEMTWTEPGQYSETEWFDTSQEPFLGATDPWVIATSVPPNLTIQNSGNSVIVSWPNTGSYTLQQTNNLAASSNWSTSTFTITTLNGTNSITITPPTGDLFFRLANP